MDTLRAELLHGERAGTSILRDAEQISALDRGESDGNAPNGVPTHATAVSDHGLAHPSATIFDERDQLTPSGSYLRLTPWENYS
jgi:hypothetical protein